jgi:hypothetical protein
MGKLKAKLSPLLSGAHGALLRGFRPVNPENREDYKILSAFLQGTIIIIIVNIFRSVSGAGPDE